MFAGCSPARDSLAALRPAPEAAACYERGLGVVRKLGDRIRGVEALAGLERTDAGRRPDGEPEVTVAPLSKVPASTSNTVAPRFERARQVRTTKCLKAGHVVIDV